MQFRLQIGYDPQVRRPYEASVNGGLLPRWCRSLTKFLKISADSRKKSKKRKGGKDKLPQDDDQAHGEPLSIIEECIGTLLNMKKKFEKLPILELPSH